MSTREGPDSIVEESVFGWVVRSQFLGPGAFLVEVQFSAPGTWWVDEWAPVGETMVVKTGKEME